MGSLWSRTYDYPVVPTLSDTADDPAGPFAGILCSAAGNAIVLPLNGPQTPLTIAMVVGQELHFPVRRLGASTTGTMFGLKSSIVQLQVAGARV